MQHPLCIHIGSPFTMQTDIRMLFIALIPALWPHLHVVISSRTAGFVIGAITGKYRNEAIRGKLKSVVTRLHSRNLFYKLNEKLPCRSHEIVNELWAYQCMLSNQKEPNKI